MRQQRFSNFQITLQLIVFFHYIFFSLQFIRSFGWGHSQKMFKNQRTYSQNFCYYFGLYHIPTSHDTLKYIKHCHETIYLVNVRGHFHDPSIVSPLLVSCARRPPPNRAPQARCPLRLVVLGARLFLPFPSLYPSRLQLGANRAFFRSASPLSFTCTPYVKSVFTPMGPILKETTACAVPTGNRMVFPGYCR